MNVTPLNISDVLLIEPDVFSDSRGLLFESFHAEKYKEVLGEDIHFCQDNHSESKKDVIRGLHLQLSPRAQGKLIRVVAGEIFDVAVDLRQGSVTFGKWCGRNLSAESHQQIWIPEGFAHGFLTLSERATVIYKTTAPYSPQDERCILWNSPEIEIEWPITATPILSEKDRSGLTLHDFMKSVAR